MIQVMEMILIIMNGRNIMKQIQYIIILLFVFSLTVSCTKDEQIEKNDKIRLCAGIDSQGTKTAIDGNLFSWIDNDSIGVFFDQTNEDIDNALFSVSEISNEGKSAVFYASVSLPVEKSEIDKKIVAYYPYNKTVDKRLTVKLPEYQKQNDASASHLGKYDYMATALKTYKETLPNLAFKQLMAKIDFVFVNEQSKSLTVNKITMVPRTQKFFSTASLDLFSTSEIPLLIADNNNKITQVGVEASGEWTTVAAGKTLRASMMLIPLDLSTDVIDIEVSTDQGTFRYVKNGLNFVAGSNYRLSLSMKERNLVLTSSALDFGTKTETIKLGLSSKGGISKAELSTEVNWIKMSETSLTLSEYKENDNTTFTYIDVSIDRSLLSRGNYEGKIMVKTDMGDYEIKVTLNVPGTEEIISCHEDLKFTFVDCTLSGTTSTISFTMENTGSKSISLRMDYETPYGYAYDDQGNKYSIASVSIPNEHYTDIPSGVMVNGTIIIKDIKEIAAIFSNITISVYPSSSFSNLVFKKVAIKGRSPQPKSNPTTTGSISTCAEGLNFTLLGCKVTNNNARISFIIENTSNSNIELDLRINNSTFAYDDIGNKYSLSAINLGQTDGKPYSEIPGKCLCVGYVTVSNISEKASILKNITIEAYNTNYSALIMKDVKIEGR